MVQELDDYGIKVDDYDPWIDKAEAQNEYGISPINQPVEDHYDAIILAVSHQQFVEMGAQKIHNFGKDNHVLYDIKYLLLANEVDGRL